jgi:signal transduction histidine kinase
VTLRVDGEALVLTVEDDGRGVAPRDVEAPSSLGLRGMQERALAIGGSLVVEPRVEGGTRVRLQVAMEEMSVRPPEKGVHT